MTSLLVFCGFATIMLFSSAMVVTRRNPIPAAVYLVVAMFCAAALYAQLGADFVATIQVLVYAGAIMVLFLFVIMLLNLEPNFLKGVQVGGVELGMLGLTLGMFLVMSLMMVFGGPEPTGALPVSSETVSNTELVGQALFSKYIWPFELASILILMAIVAAVVVAKKQHAATDETK